MRVRDVINPAYWVNRAIDKRIEYNMKGAIKHMEYNPLLTSITTLETDKQVTRRMLEGSIWYSGNEQDLAYFYKKEAPKFYRHGEASESLNYFWANNRSDIRKIHSGIPQLLSEKMVDLIIGNGYEYSIEGENEETLHEDLEAILEDNRFRTLLAKSIETESWSGGVSWKLSFNPDLSEYPIIEVWQPENYTCKIISGRIVEDIFYIYYEKDNRTYRLSEIYGVDSKGAYIDYKLERLQFTNNSQTNKNNKWIPAAMSELEETKELKRISFDGFYKRLSAYKPNKLPNSEFRYSLMGESDYAGSFPAFDALDEIISTWVQELRDGKLHRYFPEELMVTNNSSNYTYPDEFKKDHILFSDSPSENTDKQKIQYAQGDIRSDKYIESYKIWLTQIINNAGFSPLTIGLTGLEAIDASAESQQEREKVSIRTRNKKGGMWEDYLEDTLQTALEFYYIIKGMKKMPDGTFTVGTIPEFEVNFNFNDYIIKSKADRVNEVQTGLGIAYDIKEAVNYVHEDKTERQRLAISGRIKLENGVQTISQAEASAIEAENIQDNEELQENGVEILQVNENTIAPVNEEV